MDYVGPDELIAIAIETIGCDSKNHNDSDEAVIQNALHSISNDCTVLPPVVLVMTIVIPPSALFQNVYIGGT